MFVATNQHGDVRAEAVQEQDGPFYCPGCKEQVILKRGSIKVPHFAHHPGSECVYEESPAESYEHGSAKQEIYQSLLLVPGVTDVSLETPLHEVRPDIRFVLNGQTVAIEMQLSPLSREKVEERTLAYTRHNIALLWTSPLPMDIIVGQPYAPADWERYLHTLYFGKLYYWSSGLRLQPVKFEDYWLRPGYYHGERRSKQWVTPSLLGPTWITDLAVVWRREWKDYPRAKLWCRPWTASPPR